MSTDKSIAYFEMQGEPAHKFMQELNEEYWKELERVAEKFWRDREWYLRYYLCDFASFCDLPGYIHQLDETYYNDHKNSRAFDKPWPFDKNPHFPITSFLDEVGYNG